MITFTKDNSTIENRGSLAAWANANNVHIDKMHVDDFTKNVVFYESYKYPTEIPVFAGFVIWDGKTRTAWLIYDTTGTLGLDTEDYKKIKYYATKQLNRLFSMR